MKAHIPGKGVLLCIVFLIFTAPGWAQTAFPESKVMFPHENFDQAAGDAVNQFNGDLLLYFYLKVHPGSKRIESRVFAYERISEYVNSNFARYAVDLESEEGIRLLSRYGYQVNEEKCPLLIVDLAEPELPAQHHSCGERATDDQLEELARWIRKVKVTDPLTGEVGRGL